MAHSSASGLRTPSISSMMSDNLVDVSPKELSFSNLHSEQQILLLQTHTEVPVNIHVVCSHPNLVKVSQLYSSQRPNVKIKIPVTVSYSSKDEAYLVMLHLTAWKKQECVWEQFVPVFINCSLTESVADRRDRLMKIMSCSLYKSLNNNAQTCYWDPKKGYMDNFSRFQNQSHKDSDVFEPVLPDQEYQKEKNIAASFDIVRINPSRASRKAKKQQHGSATTASVVSRRSMQDSGSSSDCLRRSIGQSRSSVDLASVAEQNRLRAVTPSTSRESSAHDINRMSSHESPYLFERYPAIDYAGSQALPLRRKPMTSEEACAEKALQRELEEYWRNQSDLHCNCCTSKGKKDSNVDLIMAVIASLLSLWKLGTCWWEGQIDIPALLSLPACMAVSASASVFLLSIGYLFCKYINSA